MRSKIKYISSWIYENVVHENITTLTGIQVKHSFNKSNAGAWK